MNKRSQREVYDAILGQTRRRMTRGPIGRRILRQVRDQALAHPKGIEAQLRGSVQLQVLQAWMQTRGKDHE